MDSDDALGLSRGDLARGSRPDLIGALTRQLPGVTLQDAQGNPWQPALVYRGQTVSGAQGQAQGLAAYLDGARFNLPLGDTVSLDLLPDAALRTVELVDSSPVYGLNALASGYADLGYDEAAAGLHAKLILARTGLTDNGAAPEELLTVRRSAVFTYPDRTENRFARHAAAGGLLSAVAEESPAQWRCRRY